MKILEIATTVCAHVCVDTSEYMAVSVQWVVCVNIQLYFHTEICKANVQATLMFTRN